MIFGGASRNRNAPGERFRDARAEPCTLNSSLLNEYHIEFLTKLYASKVRFIVIGGQAKFLYSGKHTSDLDIWVEYEPENILRFATCFGAWTQNYESHVGLKLRQLANIPSNFANKIQTNTQIQLPDDDVSIQVGEDTLALGESNNIDILFCIDPAEMLNLSFLDAFHLATKRHFREAEIAFLCESHCNLVNNLMGK